MEAEPQLNAAFMPQLVLASPMPAAGACPIPVNFANRHDMMSKAANAKKRPCTTTGWKRSALGLSREGLLRD
jgi:hypothetical protein